LLSEEEWQAHALPLQLPGMVLRLCWFRTVRYLGETAQAKCRLWILGATSHMGNNNRWAREGGVIDEILVENMFRNKEGNTIIFDTILLEKVTNEPNITLLLNTAVFGLEKKGQLKTYRP
jgi:hypothetical protein